MLRILDPEVISYEKAILRDLADFGIDHRNPGTTHGWNYILDHTWLTRELDTYLVGRKKDGLLILDVGCGRSRYHDFLEERLGVGIVGIDRPSGFGHVGEMRNVDYREDFLDLAAFKDDTVDIILWLSSIEHNRPETIRQLHQKSMRLLKSGGLLLATLAVAESTHWFDDSEQTNLSPADCVELLEQQSIAGDFDAIREKYRQNALLLRDKYQLRYGRFDEDDPRFIVAGVKQIKRSARPAPRAARRDGSSPREQVDMLFFIEPMSTLEEPFMHKYWWYFTHRMLSTLEKDRARSYSFRVIMSEPVRTQVLDTHTPEKYGVTTIPQETLLRKFDFDYYRASLAWYGKTYTQEQLEYSAQLVKDTLGNWSPDIVVSFSPVPYVREAFPKALVLHHEYGITSRPPFPESFYFDPEGFYRDSYLMRHAPLIRKVPIRPSERMALERYRRYFVDLIEAHNPFRGFLDGVHDRFNKTILVPLQAARTYWFDGNCDFTSQFQFVQYVLANVPESIGVIFSPHPDYPALTPDVITYLRATYPHFIYSAELETIRSASQYLIGHVDAVVSVSSMVGLQALIWKKKIVALGTGQVRLAADAVSLTDIQALLDTPPVDHDNILLWLLTRYCIPADYLYDPDWFSSFLARALESHRKGRGYRALYEPIDDADVLVDRLIESAIPEIPVKNSVVSPGALRNLLSERDHEIDELTEQAGRLQNEKETSETLEAALNQQVAQLRTERVLQDSREAALNQQVTQLRREKALQDSREADLSRQAAQLQKERELLESRVQSLLNDAERLQEHVSSLDAELEGYRTGFLSSFFRWAREWANRYLPRGSHRRRAALMFGRGMLILAREGPRSLLRRVTAKLSQSPRSATSIAEPVAPTNKPGVPDALGFTGAQGDQAPEAALPADALQQHLKARLHDFLTDFTARLVFPACDEPLVSILMGTYNKAELTLQCLESLLLHTPLAYDLVIVDDASTDETKDLLGRLDNVKVVHNAENLEFIRTNNIGAEHTRGKYVLFLNNDIKAAPGWLDSLLETMDDHPDAGAVGAKLVWPDGILQEAGSIVWQDGSCLGYGRGDNPEKPEYNHLREVDYCSAACLLVKADIFHKLGFFDERYAPAFYEDADLCLGLRELGYKVYYQPRCSVTHFEFGSRSAERAAGLCAVNRVKFFEKWRDTLSKQQLARPEDRLATVRGRDRRPGRRVLLMDDMIPAPRLGSGFPRTRAMLEILVDLGYVTSYVPLTNPTKWQPDTQSLQQRGVEVFHDGWADPEALLRDRAGYYDVIVISRPHNGQRFLDVARRQNPRAWLVYDAEAVFAARDILQAELDGRPFSDKEKEARIREETAVMLRADIVVTVSQSERKLVLAHCTHDRVVVWGHSHPIVPPKTPFNERKDLLFVGGFTGGHPPNTDAVTFFARQVFPGILKAVPGIRLYIVGYNPGEAVRKLASDSILVEGFVEDLGEYYERCRIFLAPVRFGAGINLKLVEAMSHGLPSVVSGFVASGLGIEDGREAMVAHKPQEYVEKVLRLYSDEDLWGEVARASLAFVRAEYSPEIMRNRLASIIESGSG